MLFILSLNQKYELYYVILYYYIIETTRNFQPLLAEPININKELSKQNDILNKNLNTE